MQPDRGGWRSSTPPRRKLRVIALDAATGKLRWSFDPNEGMKAVGQARNRGVTYWSDGRAARIFVVRCHLLYALDAQTGKPATDFGENGAVDLREGLGRPRKSSSSAPPRRASSTRTC